MNARIELTAERIDRLVLGELQGEEYAQTIQALDANPACWRECALAFLREQALQQDLTTLVRDGFTPQLTTDSPTATALAEDASHDDTDWTEAADAPNSRWLVDFRYGSWAAAAAMLLLSFTIGWTISDLRQQKAIDGNSMTIGSAPMLDEPQLVSGDSAASPLDTPPNGFFTSNSVLPIDRKIPEWLAKLERQGRIGIETYDSIVPVTLDGGIEAVVPVQQFKVTPVARSY